MLVSGWVPLVLSLPVQPPEAVQAVAPVELQARVELPPEETELGEAEMDTVGVGGRVTVTEAEEAADPPAPVQVRVYVVLVEGDTVVVPPEAGERVPTPWLM